MGFPCSRRPVRRKRLPTPSFSQEHGAVVLSRSFDYSLFERSPGLVWNRGSERADIVGWAKFMLQVNITNDQQQDHLTHAETTLHFGRNPQADGTCITIDDRFVSRDQFQLDDLDDGTIRIENCGRAAVKVTGGDEISQGDSRVLHLPALLTVGRSVIDVSPAEPAKGDDEFLTVGIGEDINIETLTASGVTSYYPFPLAYGYRLLSSITTPSELYKEQLRIAENVLSFVASVATAMLQDDEIDQVNQKVQGSALSLWQGGISPGDWWSLAIHASEQLRKREQDDSLSQALAGLQINKDKKGFGQIVRDLIRAKNDFKHDRGPSIESEYIDATDKVEDQLTEAYEYLHFFQDHRILLVEDVNPRRRGEESDVLSLICMGDHPGFDTEQAVMAQNVRKGDLYIEGESRQLQPLYPFIHATTSSQTKAREFFFIDRVDQDRSSGSYVAGLKSFDRGNTERDPDIGNELQEIFGTT